MSGLGLGSMRRLGSCRQGMQPGLCREWEVTQAWVVGVQLGKTRLLLTDFRYRSLHLFPPPHPTPATFRFPSTIQTGIMHMPLAPVHLLSAPHHLFI